ncbi:MAG: hypothetical protein GX638_15590, partial [Crenarchaeota archaeon]|nr:hypothetical protein [Thermoproteota archaeon]
MKKSILTIIIMVMIGINLYGCNAGSPTDPGDPIDVVMMKIARVTDATYKVIADIDIVRQLSTQLNGYDSQSSLYIELSNEAYEDLISGYELLDTYYITLIFSKSNETSFEVYNDGTIIKLKNDKRYLCQVSTDYDFIKGLYSFNESLKNNLTYDKVNVSNFFNLFNSSFDVSEDNTQYTIDNCYRIYSKDLLINNTYQVYKFANNCASFLLYDDVIYELGPWFGGLGVVDIKIADIDDDGFDEVYFTNSWGSGTHWNGLSYFDTKDNNIHQLFTEKKHYQELMLTNSESGIIVSRAYFSSSASNTFAYVDLTLTEKSV